ncbi:MAG TPA: hypothetical protein VMH49_00885 [Thermoplasmata archaeon]|nr:hypothetical protein [Thermoplasmata archaeon]
MDAHAVAPASHARAPGHRLTVLTIIGSAVLSGLGMIGTIYWLITFRWILFASLVPFVVGAYLLFTRATGPDHA